MNIGIEQIGALILTGISVGFASGLLGVGGCFIMVSVQFWALTSIGVDPTIAIRTAFGTNLAVVLPTALSGAIGHSRKGAVSWRAALYLGISGLLGAILGAYWATLLPGKVLKMGFGLAIIAGAIRMLTAKPPKKSGESVNQPWRYLVLGFPLGIVSGIIGIGGGVLMIPALVLFLKFDMHKAVGTSTALMIFTSIGGIISYIINGWHLSGLPPYSIGYVNLLQWSLLAGTSVPMAQIGVKAAHRLPAPKLKKIFIVVMLYMGLKMTGFFSWIHWPL